MKTCAEAGRRTALLAMRGDGCGCAQISLLLLTPSSDPSTTREHLVVDGVTDRIVKGSARQFVAAAQGALLCHYAQPEIRSVLEQVLVPSLFSQGEWLDLSDLTQEALLRRSIQADRISLRDLARRQGISIDRSEPAHRSSMGAVDLLADLFRPFFLPQLRNIDGSYQPLRIERAGGLTPDDFGLLSGDPEPAPDVPDVDPPAGLGWRQGPWSPSEALDCALRFRRGADLVALSQLTRRSPRAIRSKLIQDGILSRSAAA
jgi:hypothetical protein